MSFYKKPPLASLSVSKFFLSIIAAQVLFTFLVWLGRTFYSHEQSLVLSDVIMGSIPGVLGVLNRWIWRSKKPHKNLLVWVVKLLSHLYISGLSLVATILAWNVVMRDPRVINGISIAVYVFAWVLSWLFPSLAECLYAKQWRIGASALALSGVAGIIGASIGRHGGDFSISVSGILGGAISIGWAQYAGYEIWDNRPWAKEEA
ncbi:MAG: hypothetical protein Kow002_13900 [Anaerolineales bacterium]